MPVKATQYWTAVRAVSVLSHHIVNDMQFETRSSYSQGESRAEQNSLRDAFGRKDCQLYQKFQRTLVRGNALLRFEKLILLGSNKLRR
jgi:hypothetical protein